MKNNFKKILSIFLVALMCLSAFPVGIFAEEAAVMPTCPVCETNENVSPTDRRVLEETCTEAKGLWYTCSKEHPHGKSQDFFVPEEGSLAHHSNPEVYEHVAAKAATCMTEGNHEYWYCPECDTYYMTAAMEKGSAFADKAATVIEKLAYEVEASHKFEAEPTDWSKWTAWKDDVKPVCGEHGGTALFACTVDGCTFVKEVEVKAVDHVWAYLSGAENADCLTEIEVTEKCQLCGETQIVDGYGWNHSFVLTEAVNKTCTEAGNEAYWTCEHCGKFFMETTEYKYYATDVNGNTVYIGEVEEGEWVIPASHNLTKHTAKLNTCVTAGNNTYYSCADCGKFFSDEAGTDEIAENSWIRPARGHDVKLVAAQSATCIGNGNTAYYDCTRCALYFADLAEGDTAYTDVEVRLNGEKIDVKEIAKNSWVTTDVTATGHKFVDPHTAATAGDCENAPVVEHWHCTVCDKNYATDNVWAKYETALESIYAEVMIPNPDFDPLAPVSSTNPELVKWSAVKNTTLPSDQQHAWKWEIAKDPTCELKGSVVWSCENCDNYTGATKHLIYDIAPTYHSAIDTTMNGWYVPAVAGTCAVAGRSAYAQCPECSKYLLVALDKNGEAYIVDSTDAYDNLVDAVFGTGVDADNHVGGITCMAYEATCQLPGWNTVTWCNGGCKHLYMIVDGEVVTSEKAYDSINPFALPDGFGQIPKHEIVKYVDAATATECGTVTNPAYCVCECGKIYGATKVDGELVADYSVTYDAEPVVVKEHAYVAVNATFDCGNEGLIPHFKCSNDGCGKLFLYIALFNSYVEATEDQLFHEATGKHSFKVVTPATPCVVGKEGVAGLEKCEVCGFERAIDPHTYIDQDYLTVEGTNEATCTEIGHYALKCDFCQTYKRTEDGKSIAIYESPKKPHTDYGTPVYVKAKDNTCFENGNLAYYECNGCHLRFPTANMVEEEGVAFEKVVIPAGGNNGVVEGNKVVIEITKDVEYLVYIEGWEVIKAEHEAKAPFVPAAEDYECGVAFHTQEYCSDCGNYSRNNFKTYKTTPYTYSDPTYHNGTLVANNDFVDSTCLVEGHKMTYTCDACSKTYVKNVNGVYVLKTDANVVIAVKPHNGKFMPATAPTCTTQGWSAWYQVCTNGCNKMYGAKDPQATDEKKTEPDTNVVYSLFGGMDMMIPLLGHAQTADNTVAAVPSHCENYYVTVIGNIAYYTCDRCDKKFADGDTGYLAVELTDADIKLPVHTPKDDERAHADSTCTEVGYTAYTCDCGYVSYWFTPALGHNIVDKNTEKKEPTCSKFGLEEYYYCATCMISFKDAAYTEVWADYTGMNAMMAQLKAYKDAMIDATGVHTNKAGEVIDLTEHRCYNGKFVETVVDGKTVWVENVIDRTCVECEINYATPHKWVSGHVDMTCSNPESDYKICDVCHVIDENTRVVKGEKADPADPDFDKYHGSLIENVNEEVICTSTDRLYKTCVLCGQKVGDSYADPKGHDYKETGRDEVTCGEGGKRYLECTKCGDETSEKIAASAHDWSGAWTNVKGLENDYTSDKAEVKKCKNCPEVIYQAHQDIKFSAVLDSGVVAGAELVNSGKLAVTINVSSFDKAAQMFTLTFKHSDNLVLDAGATKWSDYATKNFTSRDVNGANGEVTLFVMNMLKDVSLAGQDNEFVTVYFDIADDANGESVTISDIKVVEMLTIDGTVTNFTYGAAVSEEVATLGDVNGDGDVNLKDLQAMIPYILNPASVEYNARADFDKDGYVTPADFDYLRLYQTHKDYDQLINPVA